ncbi:endonuclease/exonuclease/phosphatase family protein [Lutibacter sp. HS1-25]|uniref:endonuclease/exonuclease/phosphatase family protein n=1 Tax=Lutibacter sp. HS1-25 TaxID=2485000 RepID=UPI00197C3A4C|nr:endonuclease/exonuclease/phosphatase family protein [Lutibacter sp. HS1-25]
MKKIIILVVLFLGVNTAFSQNKYEIRTVAFYNLENLFDTENDTLTDDEASPIMAIIENREEVYLQKLNNMAKVISEIGFEDANNSPVILGVAEVENRKVLEDLVHTDFLKDKNYEIIHYDSPDLRGIDVGFLYQPAFFNPISHETFELRLWDENGMRNYTRDQLLVSGYLNGELIHIIVNHWPSRRGGEEVSSAKREKAAYLNTEIIKKIRENDSNAKIIIMGDLNDDPINKSLKEVLKTKGDKNNVVEGDIYNPTEQMFKRGENTLAYRDNINFFDQMMVSSTFLTQNNTYDSYKLYKVKVFNPPYLTTQTGKYKGYPFRSFAGGNFTGGYSDHYPVYMYLIREVDSE